MKVAIVHNSVGRNERDAATRDVLDQVRDVGKALVQGGHVCRRFGLGNDVRGFLGRLSAFRPKRIFNLVEAARGESASFAWAAGLWELIGLPYTGSSARALALTADKGLAKTVMAHHGVLTPEWRSIPPLAQSSGLSLFPETWRSVPGPWIIKPAREDGSVGIEEDSVVSDEQLLPQKIAAIRSQFPRQPIQVEHFVDGREFNVSLLGGPQGPKALPVAEMIFEGYPPEKVKVLGYRSKWDPTAYEYHHTPNNFAFPPEDEKLLRRLRADAMTCWEIFGLRGYARIDMRVAPGGRVYVLDVNANPCLAPDAGFYAAAMQAGMTATELMEAILEDCVCPP
jgi:D-alanine-D-alanine ligase